METRTVTNQIIELCEEGVFDPHEVLELFLNHMSEKDVASMARELKLFEEDEDE